MKEFIKKLIPQYILQAYHYSLAILAKVIYGNPSAKMDIIGVTGTAGKSSTCYFTAQVLESTGKKIGMTTTTLFKINKQEWLNDKKMTMLGRFQTQKLLKKMVKAGCEIAIIETSSEGVKQYRHIGIEYDILVFTNLYPEHIEAHGGFENYKQAKGKLFRHLKKTLKKKIKKIIIINKDDKYADYFSNFWAEKKISYGIENKADITLNNLEINLLGEYNRYNILAAKAVAKEFKINDQQIKKAVKNLKPLPGRLEFIENNLGVKILIDYSFEPQAVKKLYKTIQKINKNRIIHILGSAGGGRDISRRPILGELASKNADIVIITNEDPYDESPQKIIDEVASGVIGPTKLYKILDRRKAIAKALQLARKNDLIVITGKGAEQAICIESGKRIKWDDRIIVKEEIAKI